MVLALPFQNTLHQKLKCQAVHVFILADANGYHLIFDVKGMQRLAKMAAPAINALVKIEATLERSAGVGAAVRASVSFKYLFRRR